MAGIARSFGRWAAASVAWAVVVLAVVSPNLEVFVAELPTDQYHAWADPILFAAIGVSPPLAFSPRLGPLPEPSLPR